MFPWQSGSDGREESQKMHLNPNSGHWNPDASARAHHIGIAVAYNVWQYYQVTGDLEYLIENGAEMLAEIARFWVSRAEFDEALGRYVIRGVIGPDEFHSGYPDRPYDGIDNNAYTNVMAVWVIVRALDALDAMPLRGPARPAGDAGHPWPRAGQVGRSEPADVRAVPRRGHQPVRGLRRPGRAGLARLPRALRRHPAAGPDPGGRERQCQPVPGLQAGRRADAVLPVVLRRAA